MILRTDHEGTQSAVNIRPTAPQYLLSAVEGKVHDAEGIIDTMVLDQFMPVC